MKTLRFIYLLFAVFVASPSFAADPTGIWEWSTKSSGREIPTTLKLEWKDGKIAGAYSNQFGDTTISNASLDGDIIKFEVVRDFAGKKYVVTYHGKIEGDMITGTIEAPNPNGSESMKLDWNAKRATKEKAGGAK